MSGWIWLPHPRDANQRQLLRWLVLRDVTKQSTDLQLILVDRLEEELQVGIDTSKTTKLSDTYLRRLVANIAHLKQLWFVTRCRQYELTDVAERGTFLEARLQTIWNWTRLQVAPSEEATSQNAMTFFDDIELWVEQADPMDRQRMERAVRDGFVFWLAKYDLDETPMTTKQDLARRIVRELNRGMGKGLTPFTLTAPDRVRLRKNFLGMLEAWFRSLSSEYATLPQSKEKRNAFIDKVLDQVFRWNLTRIWSQLDSSSKMGVQSALGELQKWVARADKNEQQKLRSFGRDLQRRAIWRFTTGKFPKPGK